LIEVYEFRSLRYKFGNKFGACLPVGRFGVWGLPAGRQVWSWGRFFARNL
jgi:hypothetical protein